MLEICLTIENDGSFTVETEDATQEAPEEAKEPSGNEQTFKSLDEALAAIKSMASSGGIAPSPMDQESQAMNASYRPGR